MKTNHHTQQTHLMKNEGSIASGFDMDVLVGTILLAGVLVSIILIVIGLAWNWLATGSLTLSYAISGENFFNFLIHSITGMFDGKVIRPRQFISLGIVTLMLTPFIRVMASFVYFVIADRNWKFSLITLIVLGVLTYSLFLR